MRKRVMVLAVGMLLAGAGMAQGQVAWDSPFLTPPGNDLGVGVYLMEAADGGVGAMVHWRNSPAPSGFGLRGGIAEDNDEDIAVFGGIDFAGRLTRASGEFPLDVDWVAGVGASIGDGLLISLPLGLTVGRTFTSEGIGFTPYLTPRLVLDGLIDDDDRGGEDLDLDVGVDLGIDIEFQPTWLIRFGATFGRDAIAVGIVF